MSADTPHPERFDRQPHDVLIAAGVGRHHKRAARIDVVRARAVNRPNAGDVVFNVRLRQDAERHVGTFARRADDAGGIPVGDAREDRVRLPREFPQEGLRLGEVCGLAVDLPPEPHDRVRREGGRAGTGPERFWLLGKF